MSAFGLGLLIAIGLTQIAAIATSLYLHRALAHRSLAVHPAIDVLFRAVLWLTTGQDRREWVEAIQVARKILSQPAFGPFDGGEISPGPGVETDDQVLDWVRRLRPLPITRSSFLQRPTDPTSRAWPITKARHPLRSTLP